MAARADAPAGACALLSDSEVERVLHAPASGGRPRVDAGSLISCDYTAAGGSVSILLRRHASKHWIAEQKRRMSAASSFRSVQGVGDSAFVLDMRQAGAALCIFHQDHYLEVSVTHIGASESVLSATKDLAKIVLGKL